MMDEVNKLSFFAGMLLLIFGVDALISLTSYFRSSGIFLILIGALLVINSRKRWEEDFEESVPRQIEDLFYYPTLPYFQTSLVALLFIGTLFYIDDYIGMIVVMLGLIVPQLILMTFKKYIKDRAKMFLVIEFHLFLFFSTFLYIHAEKLFIFKISPGILKTAFFVGAWTVEIVRLYIVNFGRYTGE